MPSCRGNPVGQLSVVCGDRRDVIWMGMTEKPPTDPGDHAQEFARIWTDMLEEQCTIRMQELGIPDNMNGQPDYGGDGEWRAFDPYRRIGGANTTGVVVDSGVLNPDLLKGQKGEHASGRRCAERPH